MTSISAVFGISDYTNGIVSASIGLTSASTGTIVTSGIQSLAGVSKYSVPVNVSANGVVQISAMNSFMNLIFMNIQILFHGRIYGFV